MGKSKNGLSKNAKREGEAALHCECGGIIKMHSVFQNGKLSHYAECVSCKKVASKPRLLFKPI